MNLKFLNPLPRREAAQKRGLSNHSCLFLILSFFLSSFFLLSSFFSKVLRRTAEPIGLKFCVEVHLYPNCKVKGGQIDRSRIFEVIEPNRRTRSPAYGLTKLKIFFAILTQI